MVSKDKREPILAPMAAIVFVFLVSVYQTFAHELAVAWAASAGGNLAEKLATLAVFAAKVLTAGVITAVFVGAFAWVMKFLNRKFSNFFACDELEDGSEDHR
jgi:hypothetical protein